MPRFRYSAIDQAGASSTGAVETATQQQAIARLAEQGLYVTEVSLVSGQATGAGDRGRLSLTFGGRVTLRHRAALFRQLSTSLEAGLPMLTGLQIVRDQAENPAVAELMSDLVERVQAGEALSQAMAGHPQVFTPLHVSMARAGETAGVMDRTIGALADFSERELVVRDQILSAATYPMIVLGLAAVSVVVILTFVIPKILETVADTGAALPLPTRMLMVTGNFLWIWGWLALIVAAVGAWVFRRWLKTPGGRLAVDRAKLRVPVLGDTLRKVAVGRFARTLATLTGSGIQILEALSVLRDTLGNEAMGQTVDKVRAAITQGESIAEPLRETGQFPPLFIQVIAMGERTGKMDSLLLRAADAYEKETSASIQRTMTVVPAVFIVVLALVVSFILAAVLLPIVTMQTGI